MAPRPDRLGLASRARERVLVTNIGGDPEGLAATRRRPFHPPEEAVKSLNTSHWIS
jgi:hypothetical protein